MSPSFKGHDVVRPYVMTGGRTRTARRDLRVETMLATVVGARGEGLTAEQAALLEACRTPMALAEASARAIGVRQASSRAACSAVRPSPRAPTTVASMVSTRRSRRAVRVRPPVMT